MTIAQSEQCMMERLNCMDDWSFQFEYLLMQAVQLPKLSKEEKKMSGLVQGCQAKVWIYVKETQGCVIIKGDSGSMLVKGLLGLLIQILDRHSAEEILAYSIRFLAETKLGKYLARDRQIGVEAMLNHIKNSLNTEK